MINGLTIPQAINKLFGIKVAQESVFLKDKANSFVRNGLIEVVEEQNVQRRKVYLANSQQLDVLFNALIINAFYPDPKHVKRVFEDKARRSECAALMRTTFGKHSTLLGQALASDKAQELIDMLDSESDLYSIRLPNPFATLPQVALGNNTSLLNQLLVQASALEPMDSLFAAFLAGDIERASLMVNKIDPNTAGAKELLQAIDLKLNEAEEFDDLLDQFRRF